MSSTVSSIMFYTGTIDAKQMLILFEFKKTQARVKELHKTTMPFGISFLLRRNVVKIYFLTKLSNILLLFLLPFLKEDPVYNIFL